MDSFIHPTAIVHPSVNLGSANYIGPYCFIGENVIIGEGNRFESHVCIGAPPEKHGCFTLEHGPGVLIGSHNFFREFVTVHAGAQRYTRISDQCYLLRGSHVGHDSWIEDSVTISCSVLVGGESFIMTGANIGLGAALHQRSLVGSFSMIGMNATITKGQQITPGCIYIGSPARYMKENAIGLKRHNVDELILNDEMNRWRELWTAMHEWKK